MAEWKVARAVMAGARRSERMASSWTDSSGAGACCTAGVAEVVETRPLDEPIAHVV
jgi:hypothetical protein